MGKGVKELILNGKGIKLILNGKGVKLILNGKVVKVLILNGERGIKVLICILKMLVVYEI